MLIKTRYPKLELLSRFWFALNFSWWIINEFGKDRSFFTVASQCFHFSLFFCIVYLFIARYFPIATSLRCYKCYSGTSWKQCDDNREIVTCPEEHEEACSKVFYSHELHDRETHTKFCEIKSQCTSTSNPVCKAAEAHEAQCEVYCCTHDLCNAGSTTAVSAILLVACTVLLVVSLSLEEDFNPLRH